MKFNMNPPVRVFFECLTVILLLVGYLGLLVSQQVTLYEKFIGSVLFIIYAEIYTIKTIIRGDNDE